METEKILYPGERYQNDKGGLYQVIAAATHAETQEKMVVYQALYGDYQIYVLPYAVFLSEAEGGKFPKAVQIESADSHQKKEIAEAEPMEDKTIQVKAGEMINPDLLEFLDEDDPYKKLEILSRIQERLTDRLMNSLEISLDLVGLEGSLENRIDYVRNHLGAKARYENSRLRQIE